MLGRLVNKFKRQTLQDGGNGGGGAISPGQMSPPPTSREIGASGTRRSARLNEKAEKEKGTTTSNDGGTMMPLGTSPNSPSPPNTRARRAQLEAAVAAEQEKAKQANQILLSSLATSGPMLCDSGTESDDDELEMLDSLSNVSRAALEDGIGRSPPTLTSSPPLISEIDTSSWDSCGCESGIVLRDSAERDDASRNVDLLEAAFGGGELVMEINKNGNNGGADTAGTTPVQSKDAFPAHFRGAGAVPMPIDFSALRHSELNGGSGNLAQHPDDAPTPIGSQKGPGQGAVLMEMAQMENNKAAARETMTTAPAVAQTEQQHHQGAFRRVLRRTRRNSNSQNQQPAAATIAARTVSPVGIGLGEKRRWDAPAASINGEQPSVAAAAATTPTPALVQPELEAMPIAARTRGSLLMGMLGVGGGGHQQSMDGDASRPVLTAARRTRVRVLYSQDHQNQQQKGGGGLGGFPVPMIVQGRRGQVAPMLGHSPPNMLVANKRGRHCSKSSNSPPRPSLNFDKMRKRMLNGGGSGNASSGGGAGNGPNNGTNGGTGANGSAEDGATAEFE